MSRELLNWLNAMVEGHYKETEELKSGVAYCQIMEQLFPKCIGMQKLKTDAVLEYEFVHNFKLLQDAFNYMGYEKKISIEDLKRRSFKHNFEFLQWFKKLFDIHRIAQADLLALAGCKISTEPIQKPSILETEEKSITHQPFAETEEKPTTSQATSDSSKKITSQLTPSIKGKISNKAKPV
uniref:Calponin-homology (CH) domain-containing protein n=1 Tax=Glossina brevipalpis TaxID=37001 RepID=A0A1A9WPB1_9MUSC